MLGELYAGACLQVAALGIDKALPPGAAGVVFFAARSSSKFTGQTRLGRINLCDPQRQASSLPEKATIISQWIMSRKS